MSGDGLSGVIVCPSKLIFHIPCPGCGITRATIMFLRGNVLQALAFNPNVIFSIMFIFLVPTFLIFDAIKRKTYTLKAFVWGDNLVKNKIILTLIIAFEIIVWIHNLYVGM